MIGGILGKTDLENRRRAGLGHIETVRIVGVEENQALAGNDVEQAAEAQLNRVQIFVYVSVIELDIVHDDQLGQVVNELRALVEKRRVVFVALDDEMLRVPQTRALAEVGRNSADQISRRQARTLKDPRQQRRRGGFSMRAGHDQIVPAAQKKLLQRFWKRKIIQLAVEDVLDCRITP